MRADLRRWGNAAALVLLAAALPYLVTSWFRVEVLAHGWAVWWVGVVALSLAAAALAPFLLLGDYARTWGQSSVPWRSVGLHLGGLVLAWAYFASVALLVLHWRGWVWGGLK